MLKGWRAGISRRRIQVVLGCLWVLDAFLQLQRQMFTKNFANQVLAPAGQGQPGFVHGPNSLAVHIILHSPALFNACFALIQLAIGILLLYKRTAKWGLIGSVIWGLSVWYIGEGLGGLFGGSALIETGAPGAALLYAVISLGIMPTKHRSDTKPAAWLAYVWAIVWAIGAVLLLAARATPKMLGSMIQQMSAGGPHWLVSLDTHFANWLSSKGTWLTLCLVLVYVLIGFMGMLTRWRRTLAVYVGIVFCVLFWVVGQALGGYYSGLATDPSTAPLIILLGIAILGAKEEALEVF